MKEKIITLLNINLAEPDIDSPGWKKQKNDVKTDFLSKGRVIENEWQLEYRLIYNSYKLENNQVVENASR